MGIKKVRFYHYLLTLIWPPFVYFFTGRPMTGIFIGIPWTIITLILCAIFIGFFIWGYSVFGSANGNNIAAWARLRQWERGYEYLD